MKIFKRDVSGFGDKKFEKQKNYISMVIVLIVIMIISAWLVVVKFNGNLNSDDKNAKYITINVSGNPTNWTRENVTLVISASSVNKGKLQYSCNGSQSRPNWQDSNKCVVKENTYSYYVRVKDSKGLVASKLVRIDKIDKTKPKLNEKSNGQGTITIGCSDNNKISLYYGQYIPNSNASSSKGTKALVEGVEFYYDSGLGYKNTNEQVTIKLKKANNKNAYVTITCKDEASNYVYKEYPGYVLEEQTAPTTPKVSLYKWASNSSSSKPTASNLNGASSYTSGSWSNTYVFARAYGSTDSGTGVDHYEYIVTGASGKSLNGKAQKGDYWQFKAEGTSYIKFRACDKAGNCSAYTKTYTVKIDKTAPKLTTTTSTSTNGNIQITAKCSDSNGVELYSWPYTTSDTHINGLRFTPNGEYPNKNHSITVKAKKTSDKNKHYKFYCVDSAGNSTYKDYSGYIPVNN